MIVFLTKKKLTCAVTESKVSECIRMNFTILMRKSMSQDEIKSQSLLFNNVYAHAWTHSRHHSLTHAQELALWRSPEDVLSVPPS